MLTAVQLKAALSEPGLINEDVIQTVYNLDKRINTPLTDAIGSDSFDNTFSEWTEDDLSPPDLNNAVVEGSAATGNDTKIGNRVGNWAQLSDKVVSISSTGERVDSIGNQGKMSYQTANRLMDLRRDLEAMACSGQASAPGNDTDTPGVTAGFGAWIKTFYSAGVGGSAGGYDLNTKLVDAPTPGNARGLEWEDVRNQIEGIWTGGGNPSLLMSVPGVIKRLNSFLFSDAGKSYRADPTANVSGTGGGETQTAQGYISVVLSDFGIRMSLVANRIQQTYDSADVGPIQVARVFLLDPDFASLSYLFGFLNEELGKVGHSTERLLSTQWMTKCFREDAHAQIADVDPTVAVTAGTP